MPANDYVRARIDPAIKHEAAAVLATMGLTVSDLCRMALNALTRETIEKAERGEEIFHAKDAEDLFRQLGI